MDHFLAKEEILTHSEINYAKIEEELTKIVKTVLRKNNLKPKQSLFEQGLTSVTALEIRSYLEKRFQTSLRSSIIFDYPSLSALAAFFTEHLRLSKTQSFPSTTSDINSIANIQTLDSAVVREVLKKKFGV